MAATEAESPSPSIHDFSPLWIDKRQPAPIDVREAESLHRFIDATKYLTSDERSFVWEAVDVAMYLHQNKKRKSGEPYSVHVIEVGILLAELHLGANQLAAGVLHDTVEEYTNGNRNELISFIRSKFGDRVIEPILLETIPRDQLLKRKAEKDQQRWLDEQFRKLGMINDKNSLIDRQVEELNALRLLKNMTISQEHTKSLSPRTLTNVEQDTITAILIGLTDRLHNMRTLQALSPESIKRNAKETRERQVLLAKRLGLWSVANELADLSYYYLHSEMRGILGYYHLKFASNFFKEHAPNAEQISAEYLPIRIYKNDRIQRRIIIPNAASMCENGGPFISLDLGILPQGGKRTNPTENLKEIEDTLSTLYDFIRSKHPDNKNISLPKVSTNMILLTKHILNTISISVPFSHPDYPEIKHLRINLMTQKTFEEEAASVHYTLVHESFRQTLQTDEQTSQYMVALRKWRHIQKHFRAYKRMYKKIFSTFSSSEILLALTQRVQVGEMLVIGAPPGRPQLPWPIQNGATVGEFISTIPSLHGKVVREILINGLLADPQTKLNPLDIVTFSR